MVFAIVSCLSAVSVAAALAGEAQPTLTMKPTVAEVGDTVKIEFAVSRETDVAVFIENAKGKIVRHLVAGILGRNPPAPLRANSLTQSIEWDGKDDAGRQVLRPPKGGPAGGGPFKVRVAAGMRPAFDGFLLYNPDATGAISALAVGPKGSVYLFHKDGLGEKIKILSRAGRHVRAVTPFPANIRPEKVKPLGVFQTDEGDLVPRLHNWHQHNFYPDPIGARNRSMSECSTPVVDSRGRVYWLVLGPRLACVDADGGVPYPTFIGPRLFPNIKDLRMSSSLSSGNRLEHPCLAVSSDGEWLYIAGLSAGDHKKQQYAPLPCVFRVSLKTRGPGEVFLGKLDTPGKEKGLLTAPRGLAAAKGLLYVADRGADRIAIFKESDRSYVGEVKVKQPDTLGVDPATGAIYVCSAENAKAPDLVKIQDYGSGKELYRLTLPRDKYAKDVRHRIAVDASTKPVRIWLPTIHWSPHRLFCVEDDGEKFVALGDPRRKDPSADSPRDMSVDRVRGELYVKSGSQRWCRIDEKTGRLKDVVNLAKYPHLNLSNKGTQLVPGPDGSLNTFSWDVGLRRFDHAGKPLNWPGQPTHHIDLKAVMSYQIRGLALLRPNELFVKPASVLFAWSRLKVLGPDGKTKRTVVWQCMSGAIPRLDPQGNIYLADMVKPPDRSYPEFFDGKLKPPPRHSDPAGDRFWASYIYGSIVKFPPEGGAIWSCSPKRQAHWIARRAAKAKRYGADFPEKPPADLLAKPKVKVKAHVGYEPHVPAELQGALWYRFGFAPYSATSSGSGNTCMCEAGGFDVDAFGRVFFPNLGQFRVEVVDTNNNRITTFGKYGNQDSGGANAAVPKPEIPLAWPLTVAVSDTHAYVADTTNRRIVRVKLNYAAEATCPVQ